MSLLLTVTQSALNNVYTVTAVQQLALCDVALKQIHNVPRSDLFEFYFYLVYQINILIILETAKCTLYRKLFLGFSQFDTADVDICNIVWGLWKRW